MLFGLVEILVSLLILHALDFVSHFMRTNAIFSEFWKGLGISSFHKENWSGKKSI
jgi:hypothetical protein